MIDDTEWEPEWLGTPFILNVRFDNDAYVVSSMECGVADGFHVIQRRSHESFVELDEYLRSSDEFGPLINGVERPSGEVGDATAAKLSDYLSQLQAHLGEDLIWQCKQFLGFLDDNMKQPNLRDYQLTFLSRKVAELQSAYRTCSLKLYETESTLSSIMHRLHYLDKAENGAQGAAVASLESMSDDSRGGGSGSPRTGEQPHEEEGKDANEEVAAVPVKEEEPSEAAANAEAAELPPVPAAELSPAPAPQASAEAKLAPAPVLAAVAALEAPVPAVEGKVAEPVAALAEAPPLPRHHSYTSSQHLPEAHIPTNAVADGRDSAVEAVLSLLWPREAQVGLGHEQSPLPHNTHIDP